MIRENIYEENSEEILENHIEINQIFSPSLWVTTQLQNTNELSL
jgi:hypothetical protein